MNPSVITLVILITGTFKPFGIAYDTVPLKCNDSVNSKTFYSWLIVKDL